jgi:CTP synthase
VATQAHPELSSRPTRPHPLFAGLVKAALDHQAGNDLRDAGMPGVNEQDAPAAGNDATAATQARTVAAK